MHTFALCWYEGIVHSLQRSSLQYQRCSLPSITAYRVVARKYFQPMQGSGGFPCRGIGYPLQGYWISPAGVLDIPCRGIGYPLQGYWISPAGVLDIPCRGIGYPLQGTLVLSVEDGPADGGPSQPTAYRLGWCCYFRDMYLLHYKYCNARM